MYRGNLPVLQSRRTRREAVARSRTPPCLFVVLSGEYGKEERGRAPHLFDEPVCAGDAGEERVRVAGSERGEVVEEHEVLPVRARNQLRNYHKHTSVMNEVCGMSVTTY